MATYIENVALVGASGNLGSLVLKSLREAQRFNITIITRSDSSSIFPTDASISIKQGSYESPGFLLSAFAGNDAVVLALYWSAVPDMEMKLIEAAAKAGVKWIFPTEFGSDTGNEIMVQAVPLHPPKIAPRVKIEELGSKWVGVVTNPWFDFSLKTGIFGIDMRKKIAHLLNGGTAKFNTTNLSTVALAIVRLLSLPIYSESEASLSGYANRIVYISFFLTSQCEVLDAVHRVTGTSHKDWTVTNGDAQKYIEEGGAKVANGDFTGMANLLYGAVMKGDMGGNYESEKGVSNAALGLLKENIDEAVRAAIN